MRKINRFESFRCAIIGIGHTFKTQRNAQIHLVITMVVVFLGLFLGLNLTEWAILVLTIGLVLATEMLNTVAEAAMDYATTEYHPQVKMVKDVAAGAVLVAAVTAAVVGLLILGPPLLGWFWGKI
jgi:undecaprenol kinase/diacylglycerol kinase (ATP)